MATRNKSHETPETQETPESVEVEVPETPDSQKSKRTIAPEVPFAVATSDAFEWEPVASKGRPRSEYQLEMDKIVKDAFKGNPVALVVSSDEDAIAALEKRVRNSGAYLKMGIRTGTLQKGPNYPDDVVFMFKVEEIIRKPRKSKTVDTETADSGNE